MIEIKKSGSRVAIAMHCDDPALFSSIKTVLKFYRCRWNAKAKTWECSIQKFDSFRSELENYDTIKIDSEEDLQILRDGDPELIISKDRVVVDYSLLKHPPMAGKAPFENYQRLDILSGLTRNRYAYFLGMGSGKSYIFSALIAHYYMKWGKVGKILIVTTNIGVRNAYHELFKFIKDLPENKVVIANAKYREPFQKGNDIVLTSYNSFRLVCNHYKKLAKISAAAPRNPFLPLEAWADGKPIMLILDESHNVGIHTSQQSHLMALHAPAFDYRYLFTGTPADKPEKLYNQLKILDPSLTHNVAYQEWTEMYAELGTRYSQFAVREWKRDKLEALNKKVTAKYGIYRDSKDILELPVHYEKRIYVEMSRQHRNIYESFIRNVLDEHNSHGHSSTRDIVNSFPYMLLASENPFLLEKHIDKFDDRLASWVLDFKEEYISKLEILDDILEEQTDTKGVIWIVHPKTAEMVARKYAALNPVVVIGSTDKDKRNELLEQFKADPKKRLLIASIQVLNTSVTITEATWQCYLERVFSYAPYEQSKARIYRIGQNLPVTTYVPIYNRSLDVLLDKNLASKDMLVKGLMDKDFLPQEIWKQIFNATEDLDLALI